MWRVYIKNHPQFGSVYERVNAQPSWVLKLALLVAFIVFVIPLAILGLAALIVGVIVFATFVVIMRLVTIVQAIFTGNPNLPDSQTKNDGRENVRVIDRD